jgi:CrcB protein
MIAVLAVAVGAAIGAPLRYLTDRLVQTRRGSSFPAGTLLVNGIACLILGVVTGWAGLSPNLLALVGTGFCATLSTYSTFAYETFRLLEDGAWRHATTNVVLSVAVGLGAASAGVWLGGLL